MEICKDEDRRTGYKICKPLPQRVRFAPYERPAPTVRGGGSPRPAQANEAGGRSGWFSKLVVTAARVIARSVSHFFSSPGTNITEIEEVPDMDNNIEPTNKSKWTTVPSNIRHFGHGQICEEGLNSPIEIARAYMGYKPQKSRQNQICHGDKASPLNLRFGNKPSKAAIASSYTACFKKPQGRSTLYKWSGSQYGRSFMRNISKEYSPYKDNNVETTRSLEWTPSLSNIRRSGHKQICEEGLNSPIEIARAYMGYKPQKAALSTIGLQNQLCHGDKASPLNLRFGNKPSNAAIASSYTACFKKPQGRSTSYKWSGSQYGRSIMRNISKEYSPYKDNNVETTRSLEWTPSLSNIRRSGHTQVVQRGISKMNAGCYDDARKICQKSCLKDLNLSTHVNKSSAFFLDLDQEKKHADDLKDIHNLYCNTPSSVFPVPLKSVEMARKILHELDKPKASQQNKSSEKKVTFGDASFPKSSFSPCHDCSPNVQGSRILEGPSSSNLARIPQLLNSSGTSASVANYRMNAMDSIGHEFSLLSMQKEPTVQLLKRKRYISNLDDECVDDVRRVRRKLHKNIL